MCWNLFITFAKLAPLLKPHFPAALMLPLTSVTRVLADIARVNQGNHKHWERLYCTRMLQLAPILARERHYMSHDYSYISFYL